MKKVLILGCRGMLGQELTRVYHEDPVYSVVAWDCEDIDVTDFVLAEKKIRACAPEIILNAVAYNAVDKCEESDEEYNNVLMLNAEVPKFLARLAQEMNAVLVHFSTDYVFDGKETDGYSEEAQPRPISRYGESKWLGEKHVLVTNGKHYVIRLSKLFGKPATSRGAKKSFFEKMLELAKEKKEIEVVDDERSCFTYAPDLARATKELVEDGVPYGIYHLVNSGGATWYEAAKELFRLANTDVVARPVASDMFPRLAQRPKNSVLLNTKRAPLRPYQEALKAYIMNP
jgi:dTDP-4-dehydrorhamnose reductase